MSSNPYAPYPVWFKKYGAPETLDKWPYGEYFRKSLVQNIKIHKENSKKVNIKCGHCKREYITLDKDKGECPFCKAPKQYTVGEMGWFLK